MIQLKAAQRLKAAQFHMDAWAEAMFKHLKRFDLDPGPGGMASSDGEWVDKDVGDQMLKALKGFKKTQDSMGNISFHSATKPKCGVTLYWDEDEDMYQVFWFDQDK